MNVFITWSGDSSFIVAKALRDFIPAVVQSAKPFMSETDIEKGAKWETTVSDQLNSADAGIICLTPDNLVSPWILFEAGALSKRRSEKTGTRVCTYLHRLSNSDVQPPLSLFQHTLANKEETRRLINELREPSSASTETLNKLFDRMWPDLEEALGKVVPVSNIAPRRTDDKIDEMLELVRGIAKTQQERLALETYSDYTRGLLSQSSRLADIAKLGGPPEVGALASAARKSRRFYGQTDPASNPSSEK